MDDSQDILLRKISLEKDDLAINNLVINFLNKNFNKQELCRFISKNEYCSEDTIKIICDVIHDYPEMVHIVKHKNVSRGFFFKCFSLNIDSLNAIAISNLKCPASLCFSFLGKQLPDPGPYHLDLFSYFYIKQFFDVPIEYRLSMCQEEDSAYIYKNLDMYIDLKERFFKK